MSIFAQFQFTIATLLVNKKFNYNSQWTCTYASPLAM